MKLRLFALAAAIGLLSTPALADGNLNGALVIQGNIWTAQSAQNNTAGFFVVGNGIEAAAFGNSLDGVQKNDDVAFAANVGAGLQINALTVQSAENNTVGLMVWDNEISAAAVGNGASLRQENEDSFLTGNGALVIQVNALSAQLSQNNTAGLAVVDNEISGVSVGNSAALYQENDGSFLTGNVGILGQANVATVQASQNNTMGGIVADNTVSASAAGNAGSFTSINK